MKIYLSEWAKTKGRTLTSIAHEIGITAPSLSQIDNGRTWARAETLDNLGAALGIPPEWLCFSPSSELMRYAQEIENVEYEQETKKKPQEQSQPLGAIVCPHCGRPMTIYAK